MDALDLTYNKWDSVKKMLVVMKFLMFGTNCWTIEEKKSKF